MRLEYTPQFMVVCILCSGEGCSNLSWMMCIVIHDLYIVEDRSFILESPLCTLTMQQTCFDRIDFDAKLCCGSNSR